MRPPLWRLATSRCAKPRQERNRTAPRRRPQRSTRPATLPLPCFQRLIALWSPLYEKNETVTDKTTAFEQRVQALLDRQRREIDHSRGDSRIRRTLEWIAVAQSTNGSWGAGGGATTSLMILALDDLATLLSEASISRDILRMNVLAATYVAETFMQTRFEQQLWDTAVAGRALLRVSDDSTQAASAAIRQWLVQDVGTRINAGPHHLAQRLMFLIESGANRELITASAASLDAALQAALPRVSPYSGAQCLCAYTALDPGLTASRPHVNDVIRLLEDSLTTVSLDSANFISVCAAIEGLSSYPVYDHRPSLRLSVASLFGETCFRESGTWYYDPLSTAWALRALTSYSVEIVVVAPYAELQQDLTILTQEFTKDFEKQRRVEGLKIVTSGMLLAIAAALASLYVVWTTLATVQWGWVDWLVPSIAVALAALWVGQTAQVLRRKRHPST